MVITLFQGQHTHTIIILTGISVYVGNKAPITGYHSHYPFVSWFPESLLWSISRELILMAETIMFPTIYKHVWARNHSAAVAAASFRDEMF